MKSSVIVFVLMITLVVGALPAAAAEQTLYARGGGVPLTTLSTNPPTSPSVKNYDWSRDSNPGVTVKRSSESWQEDDPKKYQDFAYDAEQLRLTGTPQLTIWSAVKDFKNYDPGALTAHLLDCNRWLLDCTPLAEVSQVRQEWGQGGGWIQDTLTFPGVDHQFENLRLLVLRITVPKSAEDDMWLAYDSTVAPTRLAVTLSSPPAGTTTTSTTAPPPTTTTTTTAPTTTTTTTPTTTTAPTVTTTTTPPSPAPDPGNPSVEPTTTTSTEGDSTDSTPQTPESTSTTTITTTTTEIGVSSPGPRSTTTQPQPPKSSGTVDLERGQLLVRGSENTAAMLVAAPVRAAISPTRHLSVTFSTIAETFRSNVLAALALGVLGAALGLTVIEKTAVGGGSRSNLTKPTIFERCRQCFTPLWKRLRSIQTR